MKESRKFKLVFFKENIRVLSVIGTDTYILITAKKSENPDKVFLCYNCPVSGDVCSVEYPSKIPSGHNICYKLLTDEYGNKLPGIELKIKEIIISLYICKVIIKSVLETL